MKNLRSYQTKAREAFEKKFPYKITRTDENVEDFLDTLLSDFLREVEKNVVRDAETPQQMTQQEVSYCTGQDDYRHNLLLAFKTFREGDGK